MTPTLAVSQSVWNTAATKNVAISWNAGDLILVLGMSENNDALSDDDILTPTAPGLTFSVIDSDVLVNGGDHCWGASWKAIAGSSGSGNVSASTSGGIQDCGIMVVVVAAGTYAGIGAHARISDTAETASITLSGPSSAVVELIGDWGVGGTSGHAYTPSGATDQAATQIAGRYTVYGATWTNQSAGAANYGVSVASSGSTYNKVVVEIKGLPAPIPLQWVAGINSP